jgi:hypothetical protein
MRRLGQMDLLLDIGAIAALYIAAAIFASSRPYGLRPTMAHRAKKAVMVRSVPVSGIGPTAGRSRASMDQQVVKVKLTAKVRANP